MLTGRCYDHPDRPGIGICVECRHVVCRECTTQVDGINRCASCLRKHAQAAVRVRPQRAWGVVNVLLSGATVGGLWLAVYLVALLLSRR